MHVLAAIPKILRPRLSAGLTPPFRLVTVNGWPEAITAILAEQIDLAVLDPQLDAEPRAHEVERMRVLFPSLPMILYTAMSPHVAPVLLRLGHANIKRVIVAWHDDHPTRIRDTLVAEAARTVSQRLVREMEDVLARVPEKLGWAIETVIREPAEVQTVHALAERARMDRRTCVRWFARAGLPSPSVLLSVLRVVHAHRLLQDPGYTVEDVARKLGYSQTRSLAMHVREVFGMTPGEMRVSLSPDQALCIIRSRYFTIRRKKAVRAS
jgi:AraC-like DNA-binding protein